MSGQPERGLTRLNLIFVQSIILIGRRQTHLPVSISLFNTNAEQSQTISLKMENRFSFYYALPEKPQMQSRDVCDTENII